LLIFFIIISFFLFFFFSFFFFFFFGFVALSNIQPSVPVNGRLTSHSWAFYQLQVPANSGFMLITNTTSNGDCDLYVQRDTYPSVRNYYARDISVLPNFVVTVSNASSSGSSSTWYAGMYDFRGDCQFRLTAVLLSSCPSGCNGRGQCVAGTCSCSSSWAGSACQWPVDSIDSTHPVVNSSLARRSWHYYAFPVTVPDTSISVTMTESLGGLRDCDLFLGAGSPPTMSQYVAYNMTTATTSLLNYQAASPQTFYIGVYGWLGCRYALSLSTSGSQGDCTDSSYCSYHGNCLASRQACACNAGYQGLNCENSTVPLSVGNAVTGFAPRGTWNYYQFSMHSMSPVRIVVSEMSPIGDCDIYVAANRVPTFLNFDFYDGSIGQTSSVEVPVPGWSTWNVGLYGFGLCNYSLVLTQSSLCNCSGHGTCDASGACTCVAGYVGDQCQYPVTIVTSGTLVNGTVSAHQYAYFKLAGVTTSAVVVDLVDYVSSSFETTWVLASRGRAPTLSVHDASSLVASHGMHHTSLTYQQSVVATDYYVAVYGAPAAAFVGPVSFSLQVTATQF
jgi:hypothetical protein